ncbi:hypothetical protein [Brevundimonas sp.]|uniref:hypothetical protein n=1 Tax=Brevundimonas sp. TaxID=1871086 RepID=UPI003D6D34FD
MRPWDDEELAWAKECLGAGDTHEDIAEMAGRSVRDVRLALSGIPPLTAREREAASLFAAGVQIRVIGALMKPDTRRPDSLGAGYMRRVREKGHVTTYGERWRAMRHG